MTERLPSPRHVVVIGGGFAGLSCAVALADRGVRVTVLEARRALGGRAGSFLHEPTGDVVDNGQHLLMSCYRETREFLRTLGTERLVRFQPRLALDYLGDGSRVRLSCPPLPAPWHLVAGVGTLKGLGLKDRLALLRAVPALRRLRQADGLASLSEITVSRWLDQLGQTDRLRSWIWHPMAIATLNQSPDRAPASLLARVLTDAFLGAPADSALGYATVGLGDLYTGAAARFIEGRGGAVRTGVAATRLVVSGGVVMLLETKEGESITADAYVSALPPQALARLGAGVPGLERFESSPILSVNLWLDQPVSRIAPFDLACVVGRRIQWLFNKERITAGAAGHLAAIISSAGDLVGKTNEELAAIAAEDLQACLPLARGAQVIRSIVVRERTATYAATVSTESLRPGPRSGYPNLLLAGDWTQRGMPATIEAAVSSGHECAGMLTP